MTRPLKYTTQQMTAAIRNSRGIKSVICARLDCRLETLNSYLRENPTIAKAFTEEKEVILDVAESVVFRNVQMAAEAQAGVPGRPAIGDQPAIPAIPPRSADTSDAKWLLSRIGKDRGYGESIEVETNTGFENLTSEEITDKIADLMAKAKARRDRKPKKNAETSNA